MLNKNKNNNKCTIFNKFLVDDMVPYVIISDDTKTFIKQASRDKKEVIYFDKKSLLNIITKNIDFSKIDNQNIWLPILVSKTNSYITNKPVFNNIPVNTSLLGIENFIKFNCDFKNWMVTPNDTTMNIDWILNSSLGPENAIYGLLCWVKYNNNTDISSLSDSISASLDSFPKYSRLQCIQNNKIYIKISDQTLFDIDSDDSILSNGSFSFNNNTSKISISSLPQNPKFRLVTDRGIGSHKITIDMESQKNNIELWIPDGDFFAYFDDLDQENSSYTRIVPITSKTYISPLLYSRYKHIYNILTLKEIKNIKQGRHLSQSRKLKRICGILATAPIFDGVTNEQLLSCIELVSDYMNQTSGPMSIETEITETLQIIKSIFNKLQQYNTNSLNHSQTIAMNHIISYDSLFKKLLNKYSAKLSANKTTTLSFTGTIDNSNLLIIQSMYNFIDLNSSIEPSNIRSNHQKISINNINIETNNYGINIKAGTDTVSIPTTNHLKPLKKNIPFSIGDDQIEKYSDYETQFNIKNITDLSLEDINLEAAISYSWELIDGPCLRFSDYTKDKTRFSRFAFSNEGSPDIFVYGPGKYTIKCSVSSEYGKTSDIKHIYVIDSDGKYDGINEPPISKKRPLKYLKGLNSKIIFPNLNQIALFTGPEQNRAIFWPIKTDAYIAKFTSFLNNKFKKLQGTTTKFSFPAKLDPNNNTISLTYNPGTGSSTKIDRIILEYASIECNPIFKEILIQSGPSYARTQRSPDILQIPVYNNEGDHVIETKTFNYPNISTDYSSSIYPYGGYTNKNLNDIFGPNSQRLLSGIKGHPNPGVSLPHISGHKLDYEKKICYEYEPISINGSGLDAWPNFRAVKGVFHPGSGFILSDTNTQSSVLKFNPAARKCFNFTGPGFYKLVSAHDEYGNNIPNIFKSSISISIDPRIQPDPAPEINENDSDYIKKLKLNTWKDNNQKKELSDHDVNHGYRSLDEGFNKLHDEFGYDASFLQKNDPNCNGPAINYSFKSIGTKLLPKDTGIPEAGQLTLQNITVPGMAISDIEVKLNFLNYINTKNLVVWLDVGVCAAEACKIANAKPPGSYRKTNGLPDAISKFSEYLTALTGMNDGFKLFLLNKEHIENNTYNFSIKFSNHASKFDKLSNHNIFSSGIPHYQNIVKDNMVILPTTMASGYSDFDYYTQYQKLLDYTDINDLNRRTMGATNFSKYEGLELFGGCDFDKPAPPNGTTTFTLNIAVLDEHDDMYIYDNILNNDLLSGYSSTINKQQSNIITNSLCSWELILHTDAGQAPDHKNDTFGLIEYELENDGSMKSPSYPGYNFLITSDPKNRSNIEYLPLVNKNAPFSYITDKSLCPVPVFELSKNPLYQAPIFPTVVLLQILASTSAAIAGSTAGLGGILTSLTSLDLGYKDIYNFFKESRIANNLNTENLSIALPNYNPYSFGGSEKILINASKDGGLTFYKLEASIFKYDNTPILEPNEYQYILLDEKTLPFLSVFDFKILNESDIIDNTLLDSMVQKTFEDPEPKILEDIPLGLSEYSLVKIVKTKKLYEWEYAEGYYFVTKDGWLTLFDGIFYDSLLSQYYISRYPYIFKELQNKIDNKKIIFIDGSIPFDLFDVNDNIKCFKNTKNEADFVLIRITAKALVWSNNRYNTVFELESSMPSGYSRFTFNKNTILVFKNNTTIYNNDFTMPIDQWSLEKTPFAAPVPMNSLSAMGAGAYGRGSATVVPDLLSESIIENKLKNLYDIFINNSNTFSIKNKLIFKSNNSTNVVNFNGELKGFIYSINDPQSATLNSDNLNNFIIDNSLLDQVKSNTLNHFMTQKNICFIKNMQGQFDLSNENHYGTIKIGGDFVIKPNIKYLSLNDINIILNRIKYLEGDGTNDIKNKIGYKNHTDYIIDNGSIQNIIEHLDSIQEHDSAECYSPRPSSNAKCYQKLLKQAIVDRYAERNNLIKGLEDNAIKNNDGSYINKSNPPGLVPRLYAEVITDDDNSNILSVKYKEAPPAYWINIDPKQVCSRAYDVGLKFLKSIKYTCYPTNGIIFDMNNKNICPYYEKFDDTKYYETKLEGIDNIKFKNPIEENFGADIIFERQGSSFLYTIPIRKYGEELLKYKDKFNWIEYPVQRKFFINSGDTIDTYVESIETYLVPEYKHPDIKQDYSNISNRVYSIFNLDDITELDISIRNIPRKLKGIDNTYDKYIPDKEGNPYLSSSPADGGPIFANRKFWNCVKVNQINSSDNFKDTNPTDYLKHVNEMIFRGFYGSKDNLEHKEDIMQSMYPWEWIPFEYFSKHPPQQ